jgi:4-carboxymuconolactone decarboxylase
MRIGGPDPKQQGWLSGLFTRIVYGMTKKKLGHVAGPVQITAHHPRILWGYGQMEQSLAGSRLVDPDLKHLAEMRVATLVGCPF